MGEKSLELSSIKAHLRITDYCWIEIDTTMHIRNMILLLPNKRKSEWFTKEAKWLSIHHREVSAWVTDTYSKNPKEHPVPYHELTTKIRFVWASVALRRWSGGIPTFFRHLRSPHTNISRLVAAATCLCHRPARFVGLEEQLYSLVFDDSLVRIRKWSVH